MILRTSLLAACVAASGAWALDLPDSARMTAERVSPTGRYAAPFAPFDGTTVPVQQIDGVIQRQSWELPGTGRSSLEITEPLRAEFIAQGYEVVLDCMADACGGFDFRFATEVLPAPNMFVNLRDYQFVTLRRGSDTAPDGIVTILASVLSDRAYVQVVVAEAAEGAPTEAAPIKHASATVSQQATERLLTQGFVVLSDLEFSTGATDLGAGPFRSLEALAEVLKDAPGLRIALVGHTDSVGDLEQNIRISRDRARAVRQRLIVTYGIEPERVEAEGMGYLAPRASNLTASGREANRRVEAIILSDG